MNKVQRSMAHYAVKDEFSVVTEIGRGWEDKISRKTEYA